MVILRDMAKEGWIEIEEVKTMVSHGYRVSLNVTAILEPAEEFMLSLLPPEQKKTVEGMSEMQLTEELNSRFKGDARYTVARNEMGRRIAERQRQAASERQDAEKRQHELDERRHAEMLAVAQKREEQHTLRRFWQLATWGERLGIVVFSLFLIVLGIGLAQKETVNLLYQLFKGIKP